MCSWSWSQNFPNKWTWNCYPLLWGKWATIAWSFWFSHSSCTCRGQIFFSQNIVSVISILCLTEIMFIWATYHKIVVEVFHYSFRPLAVNLSMCNSAITHVGTCDFISVAFIPLFIFMIQLMHLQRDPFLKAFWHNIFNMAYVVLTLWSHRNTYEASWNI